MISEKNYATQKPQGRIDKLILKKRLAMYSIFNSEFIDDITENVLDVGVTSDDQALSANFFEEQFPDKKKIIALSDQSALFLEKQYPGLVFKQGDARQLPFEDNSIDVVFSSAVIEHVGSEDNQLKMISECYRVCRKGVFITTPNRWFPIDPHTSLPLIHWLPKRWHRLLLKKFGYDFFSHEKNLNLLNKKTIMRLCENIQIKKISIKKIKTLGWTSNLMIIIRK